MRVVAIGGGTGLSTLLKGLKVHDVDITAVVAVTDEGGSSGIIRREFRVPPPGDVRNNFVALSENEELLGRIFNYRFDEGFLKGHTVGNVILAALMLMNDGSLAKAVETLSKILAIKGKIYPVSDELVRLVAKKSGREYVGEVEITSVKGRIEEIRLDRKVKALQEVVEAIEDADLIVVGPGSLYTSVITNFLVDGTSQAVRSSRGLLVYVANIMTQPGETEGMRLSDHVREVEKYIGRDVDYVVANSGRPSADVLKRYEEEGYELLELDLENVKRPVVVDHFAIEVVDEFDGKKKVRHDPFKLAGEILRIAGWLA